LTDVLQGTAVRVLGMTSPTIKTGSVVGVSEKVEIHYDDQSSQRFVGMIGLARVSGMTFHPLTAGGDSGALVVDDNGNAIGMIIGAGKSATYAMPLNRLFTDLDLSFT
jgi:hypothetical protein